MCGYRSKCPQVLNIPGGFRGEGTYTRTPLVNTMKYVQVPTAWSNTINLELAPTSHFTKFVEQQSLIKTESHGQSMFSGGLNTVL